MASSKGGSWYTRPYEGGWRKTSGADTNGWFNDFVTYNKNGDHDGYCYTPTYSTKGFCFCFKFTDISNFVSATKLDIQIPLIRSGSNPAKKGTLYIKMFTTDMETANFGNDFKPTANNCVASASWASSNYAAFSCTFSIGADKLKDFNIRNNTYIYITVGGNNLIQIGSPGCTPDNDWWSATLSYSAYTPVGKPSITITDNYDNSFTITATKGADGTNNPVTGLDNLYWDYTESYDSEYTYTSGEPISLTLSGTENTRTVYAKARSVATYGPSQEDTANEAINQYIAPSTPGTPTINYTKSRLTIKEPWTAKWRAATAANTNSPIIGYRIYLFKKDTVLTSIHIKDSAGNQISADAADEIKVGSNTYRYYYYDTESIDCEYTIYPEHMFAPGDTVKVGIKAYTKNGKGTKLFSTDGQGYALPVFSTANYPVQNAGIVKVNTGTPAKPVWAEGQVKVYTAKAGKPNEFEWKEAEMVKVYNGSTWDDSK
jgi:uncharacterized protein YcfL